MKKILLLLALLPSFLLAQNYTTGTLTLTKDTIFDLGSSKFITVSQFTGGYLQVSNLSARDAILEEKRAVGMMVTYDSGSGFITARYEGSDVTDINWENTSNWGLFTAGVEFPIVVTDTLVLGGDTILQIADISDTTMFNRTGGVISPKTISDSLGIGLANPNNLFQVKDIFETNPSTFSTHVGVNAGNSNTGNFNVFLGHEAGQDNLGGGANTFLGSRSGKGNTTGGSNTFTGHESGYTNKTGVQNTFTGKSAGYESLGSGNTFTGFSSGGDNTDGDNNTFTGHESGENNTTGEGNTFIGKAAGYSNVTGINNVFLGINSGYYELDSNKLHIANSKTTTPLIYGEFDNEKVIINGDLNITIKDNVSDPDSVLSETATGEIGMTKTVSLDGITGNIANSSTPLDTVFTDVIGGDVLVSGVLSNTDTTDLYKATGGIIGADTTSVSVTTEWTTIKGFTDGPTVINITTTDSSVAGMSGVYNAAVNLTMNYTAPNRTLEFSIFEVSVTDYKLPAVGFFHSTGVGGNWDSESFTYYGGGFPSSFEFVIKVRDLTGSGTLEITYFSLSIERQN